tara:strand:+ start:8475 stop:11633 length:3159 start_codon:yes stop_codon:yes gene_type:complete
MSHLATDAFPYITIRRVVIDRQEVTVDAFITTHDDGNSPFWLNEQVFSDYIKFYFILAPKRFNSPLRASLLYSPESRVDNVIESFVPGGILQDMDSGINIAANRENWFSLIENVNLFSTKAVSLSEVLQINSDSIVTTSALDLNSGNLQDLNFSVTIPMNYATRVDLRRSELELYAFSHLDVAKMIEDFNLDAHQQSISEMIKLGGNFKKEKLLEISPTGLIRVPETSTTLVYEDGTPYHGVYHYHDGDGPDGYTGYMEGQRSVMHEGARTLREVTINYRKVIANFLIEDLLFTPENPFNGSSDLISALDSNYNSPWADERSFIGKTFSSSNLYRDPDQNIISSVAMSAQEQMSQNLDSIFDPDNIESTREQYYNFLAERSDFSIVGNSIHFLTQLEGEDTSHNTSFTIYFEKMIKAKSKYAFLIENLTRLLARRIPNPGDQEAVRKVLSLFVIKDLQIKRFRVSNSSRSNNIIGTADYDMFDTDEEEVLITRGSEEGGIFIQTYGLEDSTISITDVDNGKRKKVKIKDYDLARNINYGKYAYRIIMTIEDTMKKHLLEYINTLSNNIGLLKAFLAEAHGMLEDENGNFIPNYDFTAKRYSSIFAQRSIANYDNQISSAISIFVEMYELLGIVSEQNRNQLRTQLAKSIIPVQSGNLEAAEKFLNLTQDILLTYRKIVATDANNQVSNVSLDSSVDSYSGIGEKSPSNTSVSYIHVDKKIPGIAESFRSGDIMLSYGLVDLVSYSELVEQQSNSGGSLEPSSANVIAQAASYTEIATIEQLQEDTTGVLENNLNIMLDTPPELSLAQNVEFNEPLTQATWQAGVVINNFDQDTFVVSTADLNLDISTQKTDEDTFGLSQTNEQSLIVSSDEYTHDQAWLENETKYKEQVNQLVSSEIGKNVAQAVSNTSPSRASFAQSTSATLLILDESSNNGGLVEMTPENIANQPGENITVVAQNPGNQRASNNVTELNRSELAPISTDNQLPPDAPTSRGVTSSPQPPNNRSGFSRGAAGTRSVQRSTASRQTPRNVGVSSSTPSGQSSLPRGTLGGGY